MYSAVRLVPLPSNNQLISSIGILHTAWDHHIQPARPAIIRNITSRTLWEDVNMFCQKIWNKSILLSALSASTQCHCHNQHNTVCCLSSPFTLATSCLLLADFHNHQVSEASNNSIFLDLTFAFNFLRICFLLFQKWSNCALNLECGGGLKQFSIIFSSQQRWWVVTASQWWNTNLVWSSPSKHQTILHFTYCLRSRPVSPNVVCPSVT